MISSRGAENWTEESGSIIITNNYNGLGDLIDTFPPPSPICCYCRTAILLVGFFLRVSHSKKKPPPGGSRCCWQTGCGKKVTTGNFGQISSRRRWLEKRFFSRSSWKSIIEGRRFIFPGLRFIYFPPELGGFAMLFHAAVRPESWSRPSSITSLYTTKTTQLIFFRFLLLWKLILCVARQQQRNC